MWNLLEEVWVNEVFFNFFRMMVAKHTCKRCLRPVCGDCKGSDKIIVKKNKLIIYRSFDFFHKIKRNITHVNIVCKIWITRKKSERK